MRNITVSVDDETYRRARIKAAEQDKSISGLVREYLNQLAGEESEFERLQRQEQAVRARIAGFSAGNRLSREALHARGRSDRRR